MNEESIPVVLQDLPSSVRGFCCLGVDYEPCIVINSRLSREQQSITYLHERKHVESGQLFDEGYNEYA